MKILVFVSAFLIPWYVQCQDQCNDTFFKIFGSLIENDKGYSLAVSNDQQTIYVGGIKKDSALIMSINDTGEVEWTRSFKIVNGVQNHIYRILVDSEGMIAVSGIAGSQTTGGTVFVFRYDPGNNQILWATELISTSINFNLGMIEIGPGGNYLMTNNVTAPNDAELVELDRNTGMIRQEFSKHYNLGSSESIYDLVFFNGALYGSGRFSDGGTVEDMRAVLFKMNPVDGEFEWVRLGHIQANVPARFYALDLVVAQDEIYSVYLGDENGSDIDNTQIFIQRTSIDGTLRWVKQYELPGTNDWGDEIISSNNGLVILARNRIAPSDLILFKIDYDGNVDWAEKYDYSDNDNAVSLGSIQSQLVEANGHYYFTGFAQETSNSDMILVRTDFFGQVSDTCSASTPILIPVRTIQNPVFYPVVPDVFDFIPQQNVLSSQPGHATSLQTTTICAKGNSIITSLDATICNGDSLWGHTLAGQYVDQFQSIHGCDSIRTLNLQVKNQITTSVKKEICLGDSFEGYFSSGTYIDTFTSSGGCDSVRTLNLDVDIPDKIQNIEICQGGHFENYSTAGIYIDTLAGINSTCDTIRKLTISVQAPIIFFTQQTLCFGEDYFGHTIPGVYTDTLTTPEGCDSIRMVSIAVMDSVFTAVSATICDMYHPKHQMPGIYKDTLQSRFGCDSIIILDLKGAFKYIPNVFSPNGDGVNDVFTVFRFPQDVFELVYFGIFDRQGNMAYESKTWPLQWEGKSKNGDVYNPGVFSFVLLYLCGENKITETGDITLIK